MPCDEETYNPGTRIELTFPKTIYFPVCIRGKPLLPIHTCYTCCGKPRKEREGCPVCQGYGVVYYIEISR